MSGFLSQNTPLCAPDPSGNGTLVFYPRTQSNQSVDFLYAFRDTGKAFELLWTAAALAGAGSQHAITPDGGGRGRDVARRTSAPLTPIRRVVGRGWTRHPASWLGLEEFGGHRERS